MAITLDGSLGLTTPTYGGTTAAEYSVPVTAFKNRIINGAMVIDQRNSAGSAITLNANDRYITDRFRSAVAGQTWGTGVLTAQQVVDAPTGFYNSLKLTVSTADSSIAAGDGYALTQLIEASNVYDFNWGSSSASTATLSFWVKSSVTGTYGLGIQSVGSTTYSYVATYSIPVANTWTYITIPILAQTTNNTPNTGTNYSIQIQFDLGSGSNVYGTANTWQSGTFVKTSGSVNWISNAAATFNITGVQLEKGSTATSFDQRSYGTELQLCQRYYYRSEVNTSNVYAFGLADTTTAGAFFMAFPVMMRTGPTGLEQSGTATDYRIRSAATTNTVCSAVPAFFGGSIYGGFFSFTVAAGLTAGQSIAARAATTNGYLGWSAE